jgi:hypothetical protein
VAQANAWHYWWLIPWGGTDNQGLTDASGNPAKRMYAVGQFSLNYHEHRLNENNTCRFRQAASPESF